MAKQAKIFTIGYEGVTVDALAKTLVDAGVKVLLDVRAVPLSRKPGFSKNKLAAKLAENDIRYVGLKGLGTPAEGRAAARKGNTGEMRRIFAEQMASEAGQRDLTDAIKIAGSEAACLLCFEHSPDCCHRLPVAEAMVAASGQKIEHLDPNFAALGL